MRNADKTKDQLVRENARLRKQLDQCRASDANHQQVKKALEEIEARFEILTVYIAKHSEATFSHGICMECAKKLYPEYMKKESI